MRTQHEIVAKLGQEEPDTFFGFDRIEGERCETYCNLGCGR